MNNNCSARNKLMRKIQQHGFAMLEAGHYLNGHPACRKALEYHVKHRDAYKMYVAEYESNYGPLTMGANESCNGWNWIQGPWPWESEAN